MQDEHPHHVESPLFCGALVICLRAKTVELAGQPIAVTTLEFYLLAHLARHQDRPVSAEELLKVVWKCVDGGTANQVNCCIKRLRKKLTVDGVPQYLHTQRGFGFRLCEPDKLSPPPAKRGMKNG